MRFKAGLGAVAVTLICLVAAPAEATLAEALSLRDLVARSERVVLVECTGENSLRDGLARIVTDYELRVENTVLGDSNVGDTLTMRSLSGELGELAMRIEGEPRLVVGERYLVFLRSVGGVMRPVGMSQGVLPVSDDGGSLTVLPGGGGLSLVQRTSRGRLVPAPAALIHPEPWERVRERVLDAAVPDAAVPDATGGTR